MSNTNWNDSLLINAAATGRGPIRFLGPNRGVYSLQVKQTGGATGVVVTLDGSNNGTDFFTIGTWTLASQSNNDIIFVVDKPIAYAQANLTTLSGGTTPTVSAWLTSAGV